MIDPNNSSRGTIHDGNSLSYKSESSLLELVSKNAARIILSHEEILSVLEGWSPLLDDFTNFVSSMLCHDDVVFVHV